MTITELNIKYAKLSPEERIKEVYKDFSKVLFTSSFGTTAIYLLSLFNKVNPKQKVYFMDTTYHFPETLEYKELLTQKMNLDVVELKGEDWRNKFTRDDKTWEKDPDLCCSVNKVEPLEKIKPDFQIWVSGLMGSQNEHRKTLDIFEERNGIIKFYPIIDRTEQDAAKYIKENDLPEHPLKAQGYHSVGCTHCTTKSGTREGRWVNKSKTECGLHL